MTLRPAETLRAGAGALLSAGDIEHESDEIEIVIAEMVVRGNEARRR